MFPIFPALTEPEGPIGVSFRRRQSPACVSSEIHPNQKKAGKNPGRFPFSPFVRIAVPGTLSSRGVMTTGSGRRASVGVRYTKDDEPGNLPDAKP
jgi:hypothetical protein